jgi:signal transduction histidine kinase
MFQKGLIIVGLPLLFELIFISILIVLQIESERRTEEVARSKETITTANGLSRLYYDCAKSLLAYSATRSSLARRDLEGNLNGIGEQLSRLKELTAENPEQSKNYQELAPVASRTLSALREISQGLDNDANFLVTYHQMHSRSELTELLNHLGNSIFKIASEEKKARQQGPAAEKQARLYVLEWLIAGVAFNLLLAAFLVYIFNRDVSGRLEVVAENTKRLAKKAELLSALPGDDEIAQLDKVFHNMADVLAEAERKRMELEQRKQEFVAMVSHDLKAPLSSIQGFLAGLSGGIYATRIDQIGERAKGLERSTERLIALVNSILEIEKTESSETRLYYDTFPVDAIIVPAMEAVRYLAEKAQVSLELSTSPFDLYGDEELLVRVVQNILSNAIRFSPAGGTIIVSAENDRSWATIKIKDNGTGIAAEFQQTIFEKFKQAPSSISRSNVGTGLGLAICKTIVAKHGGDIGVESSPGEGSTFWFRIPAPAVEAQA